MKKSISLLLTVILLMLPLIGCSAFESKEERILGTWYINLDKHNLSESDKLTERLTSPVTFYSDGTFSGDLVYMIYSMSSDDYYIGGSSNSGGEWEYLEKEDIFKIGSYFWGFTMFEIKFSGDNMTVTCMDDIRAFYDEITTLEEEYDIFTTMYAESVEYKRA